MLWLLILAVLATAESTAGPNLSCGTSLERSAIDETFCGDNIPLTCEDSKYQSYDGSCNNLEHSWWGTPFTPYTRLVPISNADAQPINDPSLPNPRYISKKVFVDLKVEDQLWTLLFMQYGQIVAHDLSLTAGVVQIKREAISCCSDDAKPLPEAELNPRCAPISIPEYDPFNFPEGRTCMDFLRVETTKGGRNCTNANNIDEPLSEVTGYMDISYLYGSNKVTAKEVREGRGGQLAHEMRKGKMVLPQNPEPNQTCNVDSPTEPCYFTGDVRVNQNPQLALLHMIYMEHHNYIARKLAKVNPLWNDEVLFEETRRIIIAMHQWIISNEFLPGLIGRDFVIENKLLYPNETGYVKDYNPSVNAGVSNEFAACAFRRFHSEIVGSLSSLKENRNDTFDSIHLSEWFNKPSICERGNNFDGLQRGLLTQSQSAVDRYISNEVSNRLFVAKNQKLGLDLKAIDIQRGRDQRVCTAVEALNACNLATISSFKDFEKFLKPEIVAILEHLYKSYKDVDLCVYTALEEALPGLLVGPLTQRILGEQFYRSRVGNRYHFENGEGGAFTIEQMHEIRSTTLQQIFCCNKNIRKMQPEVLKLISEKNALELCKHVRKFNPLPWKENKAVKIKDKVIIFGKQTDFVNEAT